MGLEPVAEDEEDVIHFEAIYLISIRSHKSTEAVGRTNRKQQQCRVYYSIPKPIVYYSQHTAPTAYRLSVGAC